MGSRTLTKHKLLLDEGLPRKDDAVPTADSLESVSLHRHRRQESEGGRGTMEAKTQTQQKGEHK